MPRSTGSAAGRTPGLPGAGSATIRSDSTACRSCCSRRFSISIRIIAIRRCAPSLASGSARRACRRGRDRPPPWTLDHIGVGPDPSDYADGVARPVGERQSPLPFGFAFENPRAFEPLSSVENAADDSTVAGETGLQEHQPAHCQGANGGPGGKLGARPRRASAAPARWIGCSFRAPPATSAA